MRSSLPLSRGSLGSALSFRRRLGDARGNAALYRRPLLDQLCVSGFVLGNIIGGGIFGCFPLSYQLGDVSLLSRGAVFQCLLDLEVGRCVVPSGSDLRLKFGLLEPCSVELALQQCESVDLSLRRIKQGCGPLEASLQILG